MSQSQSHRVIKTRRHRVRESERNGVTITIRVTESQSLSHRDTVTESESLSHNVREPERHIEAENHSHRFTDSESQNRISHSH